MALHSLRATARTSLWALSERTTLFSLRTSAGAPWLRPQALHRALSSDPMNPRSTAELKSKYSDVARSRDVALRNDHHALKNDFPEHAFSPGQNSIDSDSTNRKRLIYRSKQRGWLEVDLLLGSFATKYVPEFTAAGECRHDVFSFYCLQFFLSLLNLFQYGPVPLTIRIYYIAPRLTFSHLPHAHTYTPLKELVEYELILNQETLDIYNFIIGRDPLPEVSHVW